MSMKEFYTRSKANEGKKVPLSLPDGSPSEHWLMVRGVDSDEFRRAEAKSKRKAIELAQIKDDKERQEAIEQEKLELIAVLVADWSFDEECSRENVVEFLREAPQIGDMVDRIAVSRASFFGERSSSSTGTQKKSSGSRSARKAPKSR